MWWGWMVEGQSRAGQEGNGKERRIWRPNCLLAPSRLPYPIYLPKDHIARSLASGLVERTTSPEPSPAYINLVLLGASVAAAGVSAASLANLLPSRQLQGDGDEGICSPWRWQTQLFNWAGCFKDHSRWCGISNVVSDKGRDRKPLNKSNY